MIVCENLSKEFVLGMGRRKSRALQGLNLSVAKGEIFGFLGPNGAGKTTTIKILMGLIYPTGGKAFILGKPVGDVGVKEHIGFLPESPYFYDYLTAQEFLRFYGKLFDMHGLPLQKRIDELLELVGLRDSKSLRLRGFSKGMLQRVGLAQALLNDPQLIVLDEPMSGLDPVGRKEIRDLILHLKEQGKTVFFSSHILSDAELICDRVGILFKGKLKEIARVDELLSRDKVESFELVVEGVKNDLASEIRALAVKSVISGSQTLFVFDHTPKVDKALSLIHAHSGRVISLVPQKISLEDLFVKEVKESENANTVVD